MKKLHAICTSAIALTLACSCTDSHEQAVRDFATDFAAKVQNLQTDSLLAIYPDIAEADSISIEFEADSLTVTPSDSEGIYNVTLGNGASIMVRTNPGGTMTVASSKGIFKYPTAAISFAKKVGAFKQNPTPTDVQLAEMMSNVESLSADLFDQYVASRKNAVKSLGFTTTKEPMFGMDEGRGYFTFKNTTDQDIKGNEYEITWLDEYMGWGQESRKRRITEGIDIPANGTARTETVYFNWHGGSSVSAFTMKIPSKEQFFENFTPAGNEYAEFIKTHDTSKKANLSDGPYALAGKLGTKLAIHMTIDKGMKTGSYYYDKYGPSYPLILTVKNFDKKTGKITLEEQNDKGEVTGNFTGVLTPESFEGKMTAYTGKTHPFNLSVIN